MSYKFTATTTTSTVLAPLFNDSGVAQDIVIQNLGSNPVYVAVNQATATTSNTVLPTQYSTWQFKNSGVSQISFITTGDTSDVVIQVV